MTLTEALAVLHAAGRIRSPWLPGMLWVNDYPAEDGHPPGRMAFRLAGEGEHCIGYQMASMEEVGTLTEPSPDTTDPATVGCLLALLREASGDPWLVMDANYALTSGGWWVQIAGRGFIHGDTEGAAIAAALIALAGGAP